ncbi:unnamed protein product [Phytomonas sp. EM1]|nr:unnamed protein product [Phytomonas sp. EM1]|eukprot:CCW61964.1 unnamed protein product [Phytomonas sp. isolate EM1]
MESLPFSADVMQLLALLMQNTTESEIKEVLQANGDVMRFAVPNCTPVKHQSMENKKDAADDTNKGMEIDSNDYKEVDFIAICKLVLIEGEEKERAQSRVVAITDLMLLLQNWKDNSGSGKVTAQDSLTKDGTRMIHDSEMIMVSCILVSKRRRSTQAIPLNIEDLYIQSIDPQHPLDALQRWLQHIYEPILRHQKRQQMLWNQVQDLLSGLRSMNRVLPDVVIKRFVPQDLIELCATNPNLDVPQLMDRLGALARDTSYIRQALEVRNRCKSVLPLADLLSGRRVDDDETNIGKIWGDNVGLEENEDAGVNRWVVQEKLAYWRHVYLWIEDVAKQLQSREWRLVHRLIGSRVETNFVLEYAEYSKKVREYNKYLESIPEKQLADENLTLSELGGLAETIFAAVMSPESRYPPRLTEKLLYGVINDIATCWVRLLEKENIIDVADTNMSVHTTPSGTRKGESGLLMATAGDAHDYRDHSWSSTTKTATSSPVSSLQTLSMAMELLAMFQKRFIESDAQLQTQKGVVLGARQKKAEHPRLAALYRRCLDVRALMEYNFTLLEQLRHVFIDNLHQLHPSEDKISSSDNKVTDSSCFSRVSRNIGDEFIKGIRAAYRQFVQDTLYESTGPKASENSSSPVSGVLWRVIPSAQQRFNTAVKTYQAYIAQCDEQIAELVSNFLSAEQCVSLSATSNHRSLQGNGGESSSPNTKRLTTVTSISPSSLSSTSARCFGLHLFRIFADFRFLKLEKVQKVVRGYTAPLGEKMALHFKYIQEEYINVKIAKREAGFAVARYHLSPLMAQIMWDRRLDEALRQCLVRYDYLLENGWHQLLSLRNIEHLWRLDEPLAECFGLLLTDLVIPQMQEGSVVHGSAYALGYLQLFHAQDELEWSMDPHIAKAEQLVQNTDPSLLQVAKDRLLAVGAGFKNRDRRGESQSTRSILVTIEKRIEGKLLSWSKKVCDQISSFTLNTRSHALQDVLFRVVELPMTSSSLVPANQLGAAPSVEASPAHSISASSTPQGSPDRLAMMARSNPMGRMNSAHVPILRAQNAETGLSPQPPQLQLVVAFPWETLTIGEDLCYIEGSLRLRPDSPGAATIQANLAHVREFVNANEVRGRLAKCLAEILNVYYVTVRGEDEAIMMLATESYREVNECFQRGFTLRWMDDAALLHYVQQLSDLVYSFAQTVQQVREKTEVVLHKIKALHTRTFHPEAIVQQVRQIRHILDTLSMGCDYAYMWIHRTQPLLDAALREQVKFLLHGWSLDFRSMRYDLRFLDRNTETVVFHLKPLRIRMRVTHREISLETPAAAWRSHWIAELNRYVTWINALPRLYDDDDMRMDGAETSLLYTQEIAWLGVGRDTDRAYSHILERMPAYVLEEPLSLIEECIADAIVVENEWRQSQQFLNLDVGVMQYRFGNSLKRWNEAILLIRRFTHEMMDYTQPNKLLGGIVIVAEDAQLELGRKIDQANLYMYNKFRDVLEVELSRTFQCISKEKSRAEALDVTSDIKDAAVFLCEVQRIKKEMEEYKATIGLMAEAEANLQRLSYVFPDHWVHVSTVKNEYDALKDTFERRLKALQFRRPFLMQYAQDSAKELEVNMKSVEGIFGSLESQTANRPPTAAQQIITNLYDHATQLNEEAKRVSAIQEALGIIPIDTSSLTQILSETERLKELWDTVSVDFAKLDALGATPFFEMVPRRLQETLQALEAKVEGYSRRFHHYQVYQDLLGKLKTLCGHHRLMQDLRSDSMSPLERAHRHWLSLKQQLHVPWVLDNLMVRDIWDSNPEVNATVYHEVLETAQGERRIEVQLHQIEAYWYDFRFSLTPYKTHVGLVKGWDAVFEKLMDDLATFSGMRASPYFSSQQVVAMTNESEGRLNRLREVLETLLEVQKRWVYLDGIFTENFEIRQQIPRDAMQFERASREAQQLFPRIRADGALPDVRAQFFLEDKKLLSTLERLLGQLTAVQRALTVYLDAQRDRFPRFFFLGDDDLLEILGNSKDPCFLGKHLRKMFTAVANFLLDGPNVATSETLRGLTSLYGEEVLFKSPIEFKMRPISDWLNDAQNGMVAALRESTANAFAQLLQQGEVTLEWLALFPTQAVALAVQLWWVRIQEQLFTNDDTVAAPRHSTPVEGAATSTAAEAMNNVLAVMSDHVLGVTRVRSMRHKCEQVITLGVYQRDISRTLALKNVTSSKDFEWVRILRPYLVPTNSHSSPNKEETQDVECRMANAALLHGFEYTGTHERLVQTLLTDKCYLTLMQALHLRLGGSPVGPAGTGKTETVKALGMQLGRHVLVFNCDDTFDFQVVSRIFLGLCQVGAWGCFDEFNRLEERILSALSQQVQVIQESLRARSKEIELNNYRVPLHENVGIFITMNPSYAGRSNLPGNLKQLFLNITMIVPDRETIAEVMLFAQGFHSAENLSAKVVPLFRLFGDQFSRQDHYDFGLRALKSVLVAAGDRKRATTSTTSQPPTPKLREFSSTREETEEERECALILESIIASIAPRLVTDDVALFYPLLRDFFPDRMLPDMPMIELRAAILEVCAASGLTPGPEWVEKICQLYHTKDTRHGIMIVGPCGSGKTMTWKTLMAAMVRTNRSLEVQAYVIDPKVLTKAELFGSLDVTTREWKDGVFTSIFRKILEVEQQMIDRKTQANAEASKGDPNETVTANVTEVSTKEYWVIFDGDVDPEWVENLNSVLDDNKVLTLPNCERLPLPSSMRIMFETQSLRYATPATVSRCGMVWLEGVISLPSMLDFAKHQLERKPVVDSRGCRVRWSLAEDMVGVATNYSQQSTSDAVVVGYRSKTFRAYFMSCPSTASDKIMGDKKSPTLLQEVSAGSTSSYQIGDASMEGCLDTSLASEMPHSMPNEQQVPLCRNTHPSCERIKQAMMKVWCKAFEADGLIHKGLMLVLGNPENRDASIMQPNALQMIESIAALLLEGVWRMFSAEQRGETVITELVLTRSAKHILEYAVFWALGASMSYAHRSQLAAQLGLSPRLDGQPRDICDLEVSYFDGEWKAVQDRIGQVEILAEQVGINDTVIPTIDTCRHESLLHAWLSAGRSAILCGPPGSGKTMSITSVLNSSPEYDAVFLNFSSGTSVKTVLKSLEQHCRVQNTARGFIMTPASGKRLLLFCDEINLPQLNRYGSQEVSQLLRQIIERGGFYRPSDNVWITMEDIQVVGACNPPTDAGRVALSPRLLRWMPVLFVDFPTPDSLLNVYGTYCRAILRLGKKLQGDCATQLARALVNMYDRSKKQFTPHQQPHYVYSPRELSRWVRAIYEGFSTWEEESRRNMTTDMLVRLALHEGLRVFSDRLVTQEEREWTDATINECFTEAFDGLDASVYERPILYSTLLSRTYADSSREDLRAFFRKKVCVFCEEEMSTPLVVLDTVIDHIVRIDRVLRQPLGHVLLAGSSGVGKTVISRFVAWLGGYSPFWLKVHRNYDLEDFEEDLRGLLYRAGCKRERICFIFDESNIMQPSFLEYMNALLASGEVPGLFEGDEWPKLVQSIRDATTTTNQIYHHGSSGKGTAVAGTDAAVTAASYIDTTNEQDLYRWFLRNVKEQLHIVFTLNPSSNGLSSRAMASPALFNRCTIDWFGDWDVPTLRQIGHECIQGLKLLPACGGGTDVKGFQEEEDIHQAVVQAFCDIHYLTQEVNAVLRSRQENQGTVITPRHFTRMISSFVKLLEEKQNASSEQLQHLTGGLHKLSETSDDVAAQQRELLENEKRMEESSKAAQAMLERIITETDVTQKEKAAAEKMRKQLQEEQVSIDQNAMKMDLDLQKAEPALQNAEAALKTVKTEHLREIRAYTTPPPMVKRTLEAVCALMNVSNSEEWDVIKAYIRREDFLSSVMSFKSERITDASRNRVSSLMNDSKFTVEAAYHASKAAGPLLQWVVAQLQYFEALKRVAPIRNEISKLVAERSTKVTALERIEVEIGEKEALLLQLKEGYRNTTEEIAELKKNISVVSAKCERANTILGQLLEERSRWEQEVSNFGREARTTLGDCIVSAAFLVYIGFFVESVRRQILLPRWMEEVGITNAIPVRAHLSVTDYLVSPVDRLRWEESGLSKDLLCIENAVVMERCQNHYPLIIDPASSMIPFLKQYYAKQNITNASFGRPGYLKQLEMAMRFGYPIILEDAELLDPAVSPLLNQEFRRLGGRVLTRVGAQDVDLAPTFRLFLVTRDPDFQTKVSLAGQVSMINFTVTPSLLQSQCLHQILLHERRDVDAKRTELLSLQGSYTLKLRVLEQKLLTSIAESQGSLLENDVLIESLAQLKHEAARIKDGLEDSESALAAMERVEARYRPVAAIASHIFFGLKRFNELSHFYRYNERFLFRVIDDSLEALPKKPDTLPSNSVDDPQSSMRDAQQDKQDLSQDTETMEERSRINMLTRNIFTLIHRRVVRGMFQEDHLVLALRLAQNWSSMYSVGGGDPNAGGPSYRETPFHDTQSAGDRVSSSSFSDITNSEWDWLLEGLKGGLHVAETVSPPSSTEDATSLPLPGVLTRNGVLEPGSQNRVALHQLLEKTAFLEIRDSMESCASAWETFFNSRDPIDELDQLPATCFPCGVTPVRKLFLVTLLLLYVRRDHFLSAAGKLLRAFFRDDDGDCAVGSFFSHITHSIPEVLPELSSSTPLVLITDASYDPSARVEQAAQDAGIPLRVVAMGSGESTVCADRYLEEGSKMGCWVLLKNMHLARTYMDSVERYLHHQESTTTINPNFRLFLTIERGPRETAGHAVGMDASAPTEGGSSLAGPGGSGEKRKQRDTISVSFLEKAVTMVYEAPPGIKSALLQTYGTLGSTTTAESTSTARTAAIGIMSAAVCSAQGTRIERLYLAAAWLHAVIVERVSYVPLGWSQTYEYSDADYLRVVQAIMAWSEVREPSETREAAGPACPIVFWNALRRIVATTVYGSRICNPFDEHVLNILCNRVLDPSVFDKDHCFVHLPGGRSGAHQTSLLPPLPPQAWSRDDLLEWIASLPEGNGNPQWLGLPSGVARMAASRRALETIQRLVTVQTVLREDVHGAPSAPSPLHPRAGGAVGKKNKRGAPAQATPPYPTSVSVVTGTEWQSKLRGFCEVWHPILCRELEKLGQHSFVVNALESADVAQSEEQHLMGIAKSATHARNVGSKASPAPPSMTAASPLMLAVQREAVALVTLLRHVESDLYELGKVCSGEHVFNSARRLLVEEIVKDRVPATWSSYASITKAILLVSPWLTDVQSRAQHLLTLVSATAENKLHEMPISLGLLFSPDAFLMASKQQYAREMKCPLEQLHSKVEFMAEKTSWRDTPSETKGVANGALYFTGVTLFSAFINEQGLGELVQQQTSGESTVPLALMPLLTSVALRWTWAPKNQSVASQAVGGSLATQLASQQPLQSHVMIPLYATHQRSEILEVVDMPIVSNGELNKWYESGVCLTAWKPNE